MRPQQLKMKRRKEGRERGGGKEGTDEERGRMEEGREGGGRIRKDSHYIFLEKQS